MPDTTDLPTCVEDGLLPVDPWRSLRVRFGMLLGVDDFETVDAYHRGKGWLHNAWLHREGTLWGLGVTLDPERGEVRVEPGLALDALGRELHLEQPACLSVGRWLDEHAGDPDLVLEDPGDGGVRFDAHVVASFRGCLTRQVPALVEPCEGSGQTTAYSRVFETVELRLVAGPAPSRDPLPYHRLRLLFGIADPVEEEGAVVAADQEVLAARGAVATLAPEARPRALLDAFRRFAALDAVALLPAAGEEGDDRTLFPAADPAPLVLAELRGLTLPAGSGARPLEGGEADDTVRAAHVATATIQELLCGPAWGAAAPAPGEPGPDEPSDEPASEPSDDDETEAATGAGPAVRPASLTLTAKRVVFETDLPVARASLSPEAVLVAAYDGDDGWSGIDVARFALGADDKRVTVDFKERTRGERVRLVVRGTGPRPVLGADLVPLGAAPGNPHDGRDFAFMIERS